MQTPIVAVESWVEERQNCNEMLKLNLEVAQNHMKQFADRNKSERQYEVGEYVFLKLQPYRQTSLGLRRNLKLAFKYYGPYKVLPKVGKLAYKLELLEGISIHPTFHVSPVKPSAKNHEVIENLPSYDHY